MIILKKDMKHGNVVVQAQSLDDLWYLGQMIGKGDSVTGKTTRKVKMGSAEEAVKKVYTLSILVEDVEFKNQALRINGTTIEPKEDVPKGAHHTISAEPGDTLTISKGKWPKYQLDRLQQATEIQLKALIVIFDRESALLARLKTSGYEVVTELKGKVKRKDYETAPGPNFYKELISAIREYNERNNPDKILLASPAFWNEELMNELESDPKTESFKGKIVPATCSSVSQNAIDEVLKRPEMETVLASAMAAKELKIIDEIMTAIAKDGKVAYGQKEVENAVDAGAVEKLAITDSRVYEGKNSEELMKKAEEAGAKVLIINSKNEAGLKLDALGGIAAILRYKISY